MLRTDEPKLQDISDYSKLGNHHEHWEHGTVHGRIGLGDNHGQNKSGNER